MSIARISDVAAKEVSWLLPGRVPFGAITLLDGDGGTRKSTLALNVAAKVSSGGVLFGSSIRPGHVLLLNQEDSIPETVRPRLESLGANIERILFFEQSVSFAGNLAPIEEVVKTEGVSLIIVDPLSAFLGTGANQEQGVRRVLERVRRMAESSGVAVLGIRHLRKGAGSAQHAGLGSVALGAFSRSGLIVGRDPTDETVVLLAQHKSNLGPASPTLRLRFDGVKATCLGESHLTATDVLRPMAPNPGSALAEAAAFLRDTLLPGAVPSEQVKLLANEAGVAASTLRRARHFLNVAPRKSTGTFDGRWYWELPGDERIAPEVDHRDDEQLRAPEPAVSPAAPSVNPRPAADLPGDELPPDPGDDASVRFSLLELD